LAVAYFSLYVSSASLVLPSVPTRRSSDLLRGRCAPTALARPCKRCGRFVSRRGLCIDARVRAPRHTSERCTHKHSRDTSVDPFRDRKSTRLNSSHVAISYAVFCLKKKNYT